MTHDFDRPPAGRTGSGAPREIGLDVTRAVALIGVVVMNYHGMLNYGDSAVESESLIDRIFDIRTGVLSTRFAATFVVVAGIGITLLTKTARLDTSRAMITEARLRLVRRGAVLLLAGYFLDWSWPGTILFYYGVYFVLAAVLFDLRTVILAIVAVSISAASVGVSIWRRDRLLSGDQTNWVSPSNIESVQDAVARAFLGYTHPALPWLAFVILGMILGRHLEAVHRRRWRIASVLVAVIAGTYAAATVIRSFDVERRPVLYSLSSMHSSENGLAYIVSTAAIAVLAFIVVSAVAETIRSNALATSLQRAGQLSLTLYLGHVLYYYAVVEWFGWGVGSGLGAGILLALSYWALAITAASWWHHRIGPGPAEVVYRRLGG